MPTKRLYIIVLVFFVIGGLVGFDYAKRYYGAKLKENKQVTLDIIDNSTAALKANDDLVNTCYAAYYTVTGCANDLASCDMVETNSRLQELKDKKEMIYLRISGLTKDMDKIINNVKNP